MRVGCYQCHCQAGDFEANLQTVMTGLTQAEKQAVEVLAFPESLLTGYYIDKEQAIQNSFTLDSPQITDLLRKTADIDITFIVGFNEWRGKKLYNTVLVADRGELLGTYSKAFPCYDYFKPGRDFPVFKRRGITFGAVICADSGYIEPTRILALKGVQIVFAPHHNFLSVENVVDHFAKVRQDHMARAVENGIYFLRANSVGKDWDQGLQKKGVGYGDSYLIDPNGQMISNAGLHKQTLLSAEIDLSIVQQAQRRGRSLLSTQSLHTHLSKAAASQNQDGKR